jgi:hypothetical protein
MHFSTHEELHQVQLADVIQTPNPDSPQLAIPDTTIDRTPAYAQKASSIADF